MEFRKYPERRTRHFFTGAITYFFIVPIIVTDAIIELYHHICFPLMGIPFVKRAQYIRIDRHRLSYLSLREKLACAYCGYTNGLIMYAMRIAGETERYWCGIKHKEDTTFTPPLHHQFFLPYGDEKTFNEFLKKQ